MKRKNRWYPMVMAAALIAAPAVFADDHGLDGLEMDVMDAHEKPNDASMRTLTLPDSASDRAHERAQRGLDRANEARAQHEEIENEAGDDPAEAARGGDRGSPGSGNAQDGGRH